MNVFLFNQFFPPDEAPTGRLLADLASTLASSGHRVRVICGRNGYSPAHGRPIRAGVEVCRVRGSGFARHGAARLLSYQTYLAGAVHQALRGPRPDLLLTMTTPPALHLAGWLVRRLRGGRHYLWEMDLYPDIALALGEMAGLARLAGRWLDRARREAGGIVTLGPCMRERLLRRGLAAERVHVAENWADGESLRPSPFPDGPFTLLYSGNLGLAHDVGTIAAAMRRLEGDARFRFVFAGGGPRRAELEGRARGGNVAFEPYSDPGELGRSLARCHAGLVTQRPETAGCLVPSKVYGIMAAGRPVVFIGPRDSTVAGLIGRFGCGWRVAPGDAGGLVSLLDFLAGHPEPAREAGLRARRAFEEHYDRPAGVGRVCDILGLPVQSHVLARAVGR